MSKPASVIAARNRPVLAQSRSRSSGEPSTSSIAFSPAAAIGGATLFEKRYGRARWRRSSMISRRPET